MFSTIIEKRTLVIQYPREKVFWKSLSKVYEKYINVKLLDYFKRYLSKLLSA